MQWDVDKLVQAVLTDLSVETVPVRSDVLPEFHFDSRVVSLEQIKTLPVNVTKITVLPKSILTPSAKDEIRKRHIEIASKIEIRNGNVPLFVAVYRHTADSDNSNVSTKNVLHLQKELLIKPEVFTDISSLLDAAEKQLNGGKTAAAILSQRSASILYLAAQRQTLRPVAAMDAAQVREDWAEINANVLVVNGKRFSGTRLIEIIKCVSAKSSGK